MKRFGSSIFTQILAIVMSTLLIISMNAGSVLAREAETEIGHDPPAYFVSGKRIKVEAVVRDDAGVNQVRCYFRAAGEADYVFVEMKPAKGDTYEGILPSPSKETRTIEYLFLVVNGQDQVVSTQEYELSKDDEKDLPAWQQVRSEGNIQVSTELPEMTEPPTGFRDSIVMDVVESSVRFGVVAGLYAGIKSASGATAGATGTTATASGAVAAGTGLSTVTIAGIGLGIAALAGVLDGDDGDSWKPTVISAPSFIAPGQDSLSIGFSEAMDTQSVRISADPSSVYRSHAWKGESTLDILLSGDTEVGQQLMFFLEDFKDADGNLMEPYQFTVDVSDTGSVRIGW
ncbi:hypothetical protein QUF72_12320 [Desulfobacterales bacterium HSG2]|nr:hypothetical protein [Desulfobacterales bacterium HSG2]